MSHKTPVPSWVWRLRIAASLQKRPRLILANKLADLRALPKPPRPSKLPKDVLKLPPPVIATPTAQQGRQSPTNPPRSMTHPSSDLARRAQQRRAVTILRKVDE